MPTLVTLAGATAGSAAWIDTGDTPLGTAGDDRFATFRHSHHTRPSCGAGHAGAAHDHRNGSTTDVCRSSQQDAPITISRDGRFVPCELVPREETGKAIAHVVVRPTGGDQLSPKDDSGALRGASTPCEVHARSRSAQERQQLRRELVRRLLGHVVPAVEPAPPQVVGPGSPHRQHVAVQLRRSSPVGPQHQRRAGDAAARLPVRRIVRAVDREPGPVVLEHRP